MFRKIIAINNVGRFRNSSQGGNTTFAKHTFIQGANGLGKTTVCSVLRSLKTGDASHVLGRKTLGASGLPAIELLTSTGTKRFDGASWSANLPSIAIFDGVFVSENVHSGDVVDTEHKRNLYRVIIGDSGVTLAEQEAQLAGSSRTKTTEISNLARAIQTHVPQGMPFEKFVALPKDESIDDTIAQQEARLATIRDAATIRSRPGLAELSIPALSQGFVELLGRTIDDVTQDAEQQINTHFSAHGLTPTAGTSWIVQGLDHARDSCPFCGQIINSLTLIAAYRTVFSDGYRAIRGSVRIMESALAEAFSETMAVRMNTFAEQHQNGVEFWGRHCSFDPGRVAFPAAVRAALQELGASSTALREQKARDPLGTIRTDDSFLKAASDYEAAKGHVDAFNEAIRQTNNVIDAKRIEVGEADVLAATNHLALLRAIKIRHGQNVGGLCGDHARVSQEKVDGETEKNKVRERLNAHTAGVVQPYQTRINQLLEAFNAGFTIAETKHSYTGGVATSSYQLVINQTMIDIGGGNTPNDQPSFKNKLSAGDRSTLALAFFLAHLERDSGLSDKVVVFDDPFNSQDAFRRRQTVHEIVKLAAKCSQVIVLSHDATFLKQVWEKCPASERAPLELTDHGRQESKIAEMDIEKACQGRTATDMDDLQAYVTSGSGQHIDIIRKMRTVLETYMRTTYPASFGNADYLGDIAGKVRTAGQAHPAFSLYDDLNEINDYTSQYHHGANVADTTADQIDPTELRGFARRTLRMANALQS